MAKQMTKSQIVSHLADKMDVPKAKAGAFLEELGKPAVKEAKRGFVLPGIGKVVLANRKARMGRNPQTGEAIKIPAKRCCDSGLPRPSRTGCLEAKGRTQSGLGG